MITHEQYGLIGYPLSHSFSKMYFTSKFVKENIDNTVYELFPLKDISEFPQLIKKHTKLKGLNVTIPYKQAVIPFLDEIDRSASFGAVNTIKIEQGRLIGYNTDVFGFQQAVRPFLSATSKALVLGTGGACKAVYHVLQQNKVACTLVSRSADKGDMTYENINKSILAKYQLIVNTTPLGTYPNDNSFPDIPYEHLTGNQTLVDLVYNPPITKFLFKGAERGCTIKNGMEMLYLQAEKAWEIWNE